MSHLLSLDRIGHTMPTNLSLVLDRTARLIVKVLPDPPTLNWGGGFFNLSFMKLSQKCTVRTVQSQGPCFMAPATGGGPNVPSRSEEVLL